MQILAQHRDDSTKNKHWLHCCYTLAQPEDTGTVSIHAIATWEGGVLARLITPVSSGEGRPLECLFKANFQASTAPWWNLGWYCPSRACVYVTTGKASIVQWNKLHFLEQFAIVPKKIKRDFWLHNWLDVSFACCRVSLAQGWQLQE